MQATPPARTAEISPEQRTSVATSADLAAAGAPRVDLGASHVSIEVADTGAGMSGGDAARRCRV
jgi:hypothetical protein